METAKSVSEITAGIINKINAEYLKEYRKMMADENSIKLRTAVMSQ